MQTTYLGLPLRSAVVVSSSPYTATVAGVERCAAAGAGAVVLKSIFEEQIVRHAAALDAASDAGMGDAGEYLERYLGAAYQAELLELVAGAAATGIPVIASINAIAGSAGWVDYAVSMAGAGASALELNLFLLPTDPCTTAAELERGYVETVRAVVAAVPIPVSVKLPVRLTNVLRLVDMLQAVGARGVVLFNRFFEPDIDIERLAFTAGDPFSRPEELRNVLRSVGLCSAVLPRMDVAVSTGVHDGAAAVKALLCGARAVQVCSAIHEQGYGAIRTIGDFIDGWAARHGFASIEAFRGRMDFGSAGGDMYQRVQYMKYFPHEEQ